jgi:hypothetical protein
MVKLGGHIRGDEQGNFSDRTKRAHVECAGMEAYKA